MKPKLATLARHRMAQAKETLAEADQLLPRHEPFTDHSDFHLFLPIDLIAVNLES